MNRNYVGEFTFHPVGHGLFYTGIIRKSDNSNSFTFIYDCGGKNITIMKNAISEANLPKTIDLLIISHFHEDHIKGIKHLIDNYEIKTVILPYLDETEKIIYLCDIADGSEEESDIRNLILNPKSCFKNNTNIFYITNDDIVEDIDNKHHGVVNIDNNRSIEESGNEFDFSWNNYKKRVRNIIIGTPNYTSSMWTFNFFMPKKSDNLPKLKKFFNNHKITVKNAIKNWNIIKDKMQELGMNNNSSNLICAHGPVNFKEVSFFHSNKDFIDVYFLIDYYLHLNAFIFQFLTGDAEIDDQQGFITHYKKCLDVTFLFQIPHHGSKENWHDWFSKYTNPLCIWPVTHDSTHKYKTGIFPSATFANIAPYAVTENKTTRLEVLLSLKY